MSRLLRALEKAGLVEIDRPAVDEPEPVTEPAPTPHAPRAAPAGATAAPVAAPEAGTPIATRSYDAIYAEAGVPPSPFPAEKLLRILDGLVALDTEDRKVAVLALDAADEFWTIDDALLDAERKVQCLDAATKLAEDQARAALEHARVAIAQREQQQQDAVNRIRQQVADLEGLLEREVARASAEKAALDADARATKEACVRECARYADEMGRLRRLAEIFAPAAAGTGQR